MGVTQAHLADLEQRLADIEMSITVQRAAIDTPGLRRSRRAAAYLRSLEVQLAHLHRQRRVALRLASPVDS